MGTRARVQAFHSRDLCDIDHCCSDRLCFPLLAGNVAFHRKIFYFVECNRKSNAMQEEEPILNTRMSNVNTEHVGAVLIVTIDRPEVRNAIDGPPAAALLPAFRASHPTPAQSF